jgi:hypothetical protein
LRPGAKVGIAVQSGRLVVEPQQRPHYPGRASRPMQSQGSAQQGRARMAR